MICPRCQGELFEAVKQGVVIDHCSGCKGIWLDQGELAKIIAHMKQVELSLEAEFRPSYERRESYDRPHEGRRYDKHYDKHQYKKKSGFEKLFDIFD
jgi:Zn-finger nucleic acid-binding protein